MSACVQKSGKVCMFILFLLTLLGISHATEASLTITAPKLLQNPLFFAVTFFILTTIMGIVAVLAGIGGGVVYTPIMMGFTSIDSFVIRATGLVIAMAGAVVAGKPFLRRGVANIRLMLAVAVPYTGFAVIGALTAAKVYATMGKAGEGLVRLILGLIVLFIVGVFIFAGKRVDFPEVRHVDGFTEKLRLSMSYWEESIDKVVSYSPTRAWVGIIIFCGVGFISGFFGLGGGWAMVPALNLVMAVPLKVAATCSKVLIGIGDTAAVWAYINMGGILPIFTIPCTLGLIVGTLIGTRIMLWAKTPWIRYILIAILATSGVRLITKGLHLLGWL